MKKEIWESLRIVWDSLYTEDALEKADVIMAFGCADQTVGARAAQLYLDGYAPYVLFSGGLGKGTEGRLRQSEAEVYADIAAEMGMPRDKMLLETCSTNTGENLRFSHALLQDTGIDLRTAIVVHQPNMGRRIRATLEKQWPDHSVRFLIAPADRSLEAYLERLASYGVEEFEMISNIVGDFQRMEVYAQLGYQTPQIMPQEAREAFERMKAFGYTKYIIPIEKPKKS